MRNTTSFLTLCLFSILIFSCRKTIVETRTVNKQYAWKLDSVVFGLNKVLFTSAVANDTTIIVANGITGWMVNPNQLSTNSLKGFLIPTTFAGGFAAPTIDKNLIVARVDSGRLVLNGPYSTIALTNWLDYPLPPSTGYPYAVRGFPQGGFYNQGYPIIDSRYILAPYEIDGKDQAKLSLIKAETAGLSSSRPVAISNVKDLVGKPAPGTTGFFNGNYYSRAFYHKFFVHLYTQFFSVDTLGNIKNFGYSPIGQQAGYVTEMFTLNNYLFALAGDKFCISTDQGETWSQFGDAPYNFQLMHYFNVGDNEVYAVYNSQLARVTLEGTTLTMKELDNDGLLTNQITSLNKCGKYMFAATASGLYYRDTATVNTPKLP